VWGEALVDFENATLGPIEKPVEAQEGAPLLQWIRATGLNPLEVAASSGLSTPGGEVLIASHGMVARIDPSSGAMSEALQFGQGSGLGSCALARAGHSAFIACVLSGVRGRAGHWGILELSLEGPLKIERKLMLREDAASFVTSPSGGLMLYGACEEHAPG